MVKAKGLLQFSNMILHTPLPNTSPVPNIVSQLCYKSTASMQHSVLFLNWCMIHKQYDILVN